MAIAVTAFSASLRFDEIVKIRCCDVDFLSDHMVLKIRSSKTDRYRQGDEVVVARTWTPTCPVAKLELYCNLAGINQLSTEHLFQAIIKTKNGEKLRESGLLSYSRIKEILMGKIVLWDTTHLPSVTDKQYESRLCDLRMRAKNLYARETDEQCEARLQDLRMRALNRYASETNEQHQARLKDLSTRTQERYVSETDEQHQVRLMDARMRDQERRANESEEQREIRLSHLCQRDHETRGTETDEQRAQRNQRMRDSWQQISLHQLPLLSAPIS